jgi:hypothetical protein
VPLVGVQRCPPLASRVLLIGDLASPLPPGAAIGEAHCAPVPTCHPCLKGKPISAPRLGCGRVSTIRWSITGRHTPRSCTGQAYDAAFQAGLMSPATLSAVAGSVQNHATPQELQLVPVGYAQSSPSQRRLPSGAPALISTTVQGTEGAVRQFISVVSKTIPTAISTAPATCHKARPRLPTTKDGLPRRSARVAAQGRQTGDSSTERAHAEVARYKKMMTSSRATSRWQKLSFE